MAFVKQFLTKTQPSDNTSMFRYTPVLSSGQVEIYALISISNDVDAETSRFNKFVWDGFLDGFLSKEESIISRLESAMVGAEFKLKELIKHDNLLEEKGVDLNLSVLIFKENKVFVGVLGNHKIFIRKKRVIDISELLTKNKSKVGSTVISPEDIFTVVYAKKDMKEDLEKFKDFFEMENFLSKVFEKEDARGGAFLATLEEKKHENKVVKKKEEVEEKVEEELPKKDEISEKQENEEAEDLGGSDDEVKKKSLIFWEKLKLGFDKIITFLSQKLSVVFGKIRFFLENKYGRKRWFKKLQSVTSFKNFTKGVKPFRVDEYKEKELRTKRFVTFFVVLVLIAAVFLGVRATFESRQSALLAQELDSLMQEWKESLQEVESDKDSDESLDLLAEVFGDFEEYLNDLEEQNLFDRLREEDVERIDEFRAKLFDVEDGIYRIVPVSEEDGNIELFFDTKLHFGSKSNPVDMVISRDAGIVAGEILYVLDAGEKQAYEVFLRDGDFREISDSNDLIKEPMFIDIGNNKDSQALYVYDARSGALRVGLDDEGAFNDFESLSGLTPRALGGSGITGFAVFGQMDSLNFLIPSESRIVRAQGFGGTTYNLPSEYIAHPSFESGTDLFGDQYVYVLSTITNGIRRFVPLTGLSSQLSITGLRKDLQNITGGYTGTTMDRAFVVFDSETERFVQFSKPIEIGENLVHPGEIVLRHQYEYRGERDDVFKDVRSFVLTHDDKNMLVLDGTKIWKINIE